MTLSDRELATVLAALRAWQQSIYARMDLVDLRTVRKIWPQFDGVTPLTVTEIDRLCEQLNITH